MKTLHWFGFVSILLFIVQPTAVVGETSAETSKFLIDCTATEKFDLTEFNNLVPYAMQHHWKLQNEGVVESTHIKFPYKGIVYFINAPEGLEQARAIMEQGPILSKAPEMFRCEVSPVAPLWALPE